MPEGKTIQIQEGEYPELDSVQPGQEIKFSGTVSKSDDGTELIINSMKFQTEGIADRSYREMRADGVSPVNGGGYAPGESEEF